MGKKIFKSVFFNMLIVLLCFSSCFASAFDWWRNNNPISSETVDHSEWNEFLRVYINSVHLSGINRVRYSEVADKDRRALKSYIGYLQAINVSRLNRLEQKAYWLNLYNASVVDLILDYYPIKSVKNIKLSSIAFRRGPWKEKILRVEGRRLSLDDIKNEILRSVWRDNRIHYGLCDASLGSPNLQPVAYTSINVDNLLEKGKEEYVRHLRGFAFAGKRLRLSKMYKWFKADFGGNYVLIFRHIETALDEKEKNELRAFNGEVYYEYDWILNE